MATSCTKGNGFLQSQTGAVRVGSDNLPILTELFHWALDPAHHPVPNKNLGSRESRKQRTREELRAYQSLLGRVAQLSRRFPQDKRLGRISVILSEGIKELREARAWVSYCSQDGKEGWFLLKGPKPVVGPRLLLAACIAKKLYPAKSPYQVVVEEHGLARGKNVDAINAAKDAVEKQIKRVLRNTEKYMVAGAGPTKNPVVLLRQELLDFKTWKEDQRMDRANMPIEEFDGQFNDYLDRIHPTPEEEAFLADLLNDFLKDRKSC